MENIDIFSMERDTIDLQGIGTLVKFTRFNPQKPNIFLDGLELANDLKIIKGTVLYTKGTVLSRERVARLLYLQELNPSLEFNFQIKRTAELIKIFQREIIHQMIKLIEQRKTNEIFRNFLRDTIRNAEIFLKEILTDENCTLTIYKTYFICKSYRIPTALNCFHHSFNVALFSLSMAASEQYSAIIGGDSLKLKEVFVTGLFHNFGALTHLEAILRTPESGQFMKYWETNQNIHSALEGISISPQSTEAFNYINGYHEGKKDFILQEEWQVIMAHIILTADAFLQKECGLFNQPIPLRQAIDDLNVMVMEKELNETAVSVLTRGLNQQDLFDFYNTTARLTQKCPYGCAVPYPITGFKSATLFICKNSVLQCEHIEKSFKAITLVKSIGELPAGKYHRCLLLTPQLMKFYHEHYDEIKESVIDTTKNTPT